MYVHECLYVCMCVSMSVLNNETTRKRKRQNNTRNSLRLFSVLRAIITVMVVDHSTSSLKEKKKTATREKGSTDIQIHLFNCTVNVQETLVIVWCRDDDDDDDDE